MIFFPPSRCLYWCHVPWDQTKLRLPAIPTLPWLLFPLTSWDRVSFGEVFIRMIVACVHLARTLAEMVPFGNCIISIVFHKHT
jgi:ABC-type cobalamin transport system permease subunit